MASQTFDIGHGAGSYFLDGELVVWLWSNINTEIDDALLDPATTTPVELSQFSLTPGGRLTLGISGTGSDLSTLWESYAEAITLIPSEGDTIVIPGPSHSSSHGTPDSDEPYEWFPSLDIQTELATLSHALETNSSLTVSLVLKDSVTPLSISLEDSASAGTPSVSEQLTVEDAGQAISISDFEDAGLEVLTSFVIRIEVDGQYLYADGSSRTNDTGELLEGSAQLPGGPLINAVRRPTSSMLRFFKDDAASFLTWFNSYAASPTAWLQVDGQSAVPVVISAVNADRINVSFGSIVGTLTTGQDALLAFTIPGAVELSDTASAGTPSVSEQLTVEEAAPTISISDFDDEGLDVLTSFVVRVDVDGQYLYADGSSRTNDTGELLEGSAQLPSGPLINAVRRQSSSMIRLFRDDAASFLTWFNSYATSPIAWLQVDGEDAVSVAISSANAQRINVSFGSIVGTLTTGQDVLFAFTTPAAVTDTIELSDTASAGTPSVSEQLTVVEVNPVSLQDSASSGTPSASELLTVVEVNPVSLQDSASSGTPSASELLTVVEVNPVNLQDSASAGTPSVSEQVTVVSTNPVTLSDSASAGTPSVSEQINVVETLPIELSSSSSAGTPSVSEQLTVVVAGQTISVSDFDDTDLTVLTSFVIRVAVDGQYLYADGSSRSDDTGELLEGSAQLPGGPLINAVRRQSSSMLRIFRDDAESFVGWVNSYATSPTAWIQVDGEDAVPVVITAAVAQRINVSFGSIVGTLTTGQDVLLAFTVPDPIELSDTASAGTPAVSEQLTVSQSLPIDLSDTASSGTPSVAEAITVVNVLPLLLADTASSGTPGVSESITIVDTDSVELADVASSGSPSVAESLTVVAVNPILLSSNNSAGSPSVSERITVVDVNAIELSDMASAGTPSVSEGITVVSVSTVSLASSASAGTPRASGVLTVATAPQVITLSSSASTGTPSVSEAITVSVVGTGVIELSDRASAGTPSARETILVGGTISKVSGGDFSVTGSIVSIKVYRALGYGFAVVDEINPLGLDNDVFKHIVGWKRISSINQVNRFHIDVVKGSPWHIQNVINLMDRLYVGIDTDDDGIEDTILAYRVDTINAGYGEATGYSIEAWGIDSDLNDYVYKHKLDPKSYVSRQREFDNRTVGSVLSEIFPGESSSINLPSFFKLGAISDDITDELVDVYANNSTYFDIFAAIREQLEAQGKTFEYETTFNSVENKLYINFLQEKGWSASERTAGVYDADSRLITAPRGYDGTNANRILASVKNSKDDYVTRIIPIGGTDEELSIGISGVQWEVASTSVSGNRTTIEFMDDCVPFNDMMVGTEDGYTYHMDDGSNTYEILESEYPNTVVLDSAPSNTVSLSFVLVRDSDVVDIDYVQRPDSEPYQGIVYRKQEFNDIPAYANLFLDAGGDANMSPESGLPNGIGDITGNETLSLTTAGIHVYNGTHSLKVVCPSVGDGVQTFDIDILPDSITPYFSATAAITIDVGRVRMYLLDNNGNKYPKANESQAEGTVAIQRGLVVGNREIPLGTAKLVIEAIMPNTVFYVDAIAITQGPPLQYAPLMGPRALWMAAGQHLEAQGGARPLSTESKFIDLARLGITTQSKVEVGSWCRWQDSYNFDAGTYAVDLVGRIERVEEGWPNFGAEPFRKVRIGRQRPVISDRFKRQTSPLKTGLFHLTAPADGEDSEVDLEVLFHEILTWQVGNTGYLRLVLNSDRVTRVRVDKSIGESLPAPGNETWEVLTETDGYYQTSVELHEKHLSFIRYQLQIDSGDSSDITDDIPFDRDVIPEVYNLYLDYVPDERKINVYWRSDEDTGGVAYAWNKTGQDDIDDAAFDTAIDDDQFENGRGLKNIEIEVDLKPEETVYVGLRPFKDSLQNTSMATEGAGTDAFASLRLAARSEEPRGNIDVTKTGSDVIVTWTLVSDPSGLLTGVDARQAIGRDLLATDSYTATSKTGDNYRRTVSVSSSRKRNSYVQFRINTISGVDDIILAPVPIDPDPEPGANIGHQLSYLPDTDKYRLSITWAGDDDLGSIQATESSTSSTLNNNNTQGNEEVTNQIEPGDDWSLVVTGYTGNNQTGDSIVLYEISDTAPDTAVGVDDIIADATDWASTVRFYTNDIGTIRWSSGSVYWGSNMSQSISSGSASLPTAANTGLYVYFNPDKTSNEDELDTTQTASTAVDGTGFVMCLAWRGATGSNASYAPLRGSLFEPAEISVDQLTTNVLTAVKASIVELSALTVNTGDLTVSGDLVWDGGMGLLGPTGIILKQDGVVGTGIGTNSIRWLDDDGDLALSITSLSTGSQLTSLNGSLVEFKNYISVDGHIAIIGGGLSVASVIATAARIDAYMYFGNNLVHRPPPSATDGGSLYVYNDALWFHNSGDASPTQLGGGGGGTGITTLVEGSGIDISGTGDSRTITVDLTETNALTSLSAGTGVSISGSGNSRTIGINANSIASSLAGSGLDASGSRLVVDLSETNALTSITAGVSILVSGSGNNRTIGVSLTNMAFELAGAGLDASGTELIINLAETNAITSLSGGSGATVTGSGNNRTISLSTSSVLASSLAGTGLDASGSQLVVDLSETNALTSITAGVSILVSGSGNNRTIGVSLTNMAFELAGAGLDASGTELIVDLAETNAITSLLEGSGATVTGSGNSRTISLNTSSLASLLAGSGLDASGTELIVDLAETNAITSLSAGTDVSITGSGNSRTISISTSSLAATLAGTGLDASGNTLVVDLTETNAITSLSGGSGATVTGSGNSRTISLSTSSLAATLAGTGLDASGSQLVVDLNETNAITSISQGSGITVSGSGNSRTVSVFPSDLAGDGLAFTGSELRVHYSSVAAILASSLAGAGLDTSGGTLVVDLTETSAITSLSGGSGTTVSGSGNSRTVSLSTSSLATLLAGTGLDASGSQLVVDLTETGAITNVSVASGVGLTAVGFNGIQIFLDYSAVALSLAGPGLDPSGATLFVDLAETNAITSLTAGSGISITGSGNSRTISASSSRRAPFGDLEIDGWLNHDGSRVGFYGEAPVARQDILDNVSLSESHSDDDAELARAINIVLEALRNLGLVS